MKAHAQYPGYFITFEGPDGSGKTTLLNNVLPTLEHAFPGRIVTTREPGGVRIAEDIRAIILDVKNTALDRRTEALLYAASRRQHLAEKVLPALEAGRIVICDRFVDSSVAYQGRGRGIGPDAVFQMNLFATDGLGPDLTLYCRLSAEAALERMQANRALSEQNRLDQEDVRFHSAVVAEYEQLLEMEPERIKAIDARQTPDAMTRDALAILKTFFIEQGEAFPDA